MTTLNWWTIVLIIIAAVVGGVLVLALLVGLAFLIWGLVCRNKFVELRNKIEEAWATIDVSLKKRYDLIPNLVATVKGYAKHESETLERVIAARNAAMTASGDAKLAAENALSGTLKSLFALTESYPDLNANANFMDLQRQLQRVEEELSAARRYYNGVVKAFNTKLETFPSNLIAKMMHLTKRAYFELDSAEERQNVKVEF